ncbi:hypothetical protein GCM10010140_70890 [Streptosporangium pseudovulgare]|uniref:Uncharacterized protein n=1 Tax=Streptosporangium pseudovulgare TaxID=35765 RepID=A0ABQ2RJ01_9ACTN|nr:hypothetical protein GCM10010140_70890 [Streptosporangium pseudovulgare]
MPDGAGNEGEQRGVTGSGNRVSPAGNDRGMSAATIAIMAAGMEKRKVYRRMIRACIM